MFDIADTHISGSDEKWDLSPCSLTGVITAWRYKMKLCEYFIFLKFFLKFSGISKAY